MVYLFQLVLITLISLVLLAMLEVVSRDSFIASIAQLRGTGLCPSKALGRKAGTLACTGQGDYLAGGYKHITVATRPRSNPAKSLSMVMPGSVALGGCK